MEDEGNISRNKWPIVQILQDQGTGLPLLQ